MPPPTEARVRGSVPVLLCGVGLFLTVVEVNGFGFDFASDTAGFVLVAVGAGRLTAPPARRWGRFVAASASLAAVVSLFAYGGPAGQLVPMTYRLWNSMFYLGTGATACVVIGLLMLVRAVAGSAGERPSAYPRTLPFLAAAYASCAVLQIALFASDSAYFGPLGHLRQLVAVVVGLVEALTVVAVLFTAGSQGGRQGGRRI